MDPPATHYHVLGISPSLLESQHDPSPLLKHAYRRALLRHHPDKSSPARAFTVDQITHALAVLSSPRRRAAYDASLRLAVRGAPPSLSFQTGVEGVDLDDLARDEGDGGSWHRACRCGNERGYVFGEEDLGEVEHEGVLLVGCQDCSLWLKVHFAVVEEEEEEREMVDDLRGGGETEDDGRDGDRALEGTRRASAKT